MRTAYLLARKYNIGKEYQKNCYSIILKKEFSSEATVLLCRAIVRACVSANKGQVATWA